MYCRNCGQKLKHGTKFCPRCGTKQVEEKETSVSIPETSAKTEAVAVSNQTPTSEKQRKQWKLPIAVRGLVGIIILAVVVMPFVVNTMKQKRFESKIKNAESFLDAAEYEEAIIEYEEAIEIYPESLDIYIELADAYLKQVDFDSARDILEQALSFQLKPEDGNSLHILSKLIDIYMEMAEFEKVRRLLDSHGIMLPEGALTEVQQQIVEREREIFADYVTEVLVPEYGIPKQEKSDFLIQWNDEPLELFKHEGLSGVLIEDFNQDSSLEMVAFICNIDEMDVGYDLIVYKLKNGEVTEFQKIDGVVMSLSFATDRSNKTLKMFGGGIIIYKHIHNFTPYLLFHSVSEIETLEYTTMISEEYEKVQLFKMEEDGFYQQLAYEIEDTETSTDIYEIDSNGQKKILFSGRYYTIEEYEEDIRKSQASKYGIENQIWSDLWNGEFNLSDIIVDGGFGLDIQLNLEAGTGVYVIQNYDYSELGDILDEYEESVGDYRQ